MHTNARRSAFLVVAVLAAIVCLAVLRLPDIGLVQFERRRVLSTTQAGWAYRLLFFAALAQAAYGGWRVLRVERVAKELEADESFDGVDDALVVARLARTAAVMVFLTLVYGIAALAFTGERGGFWLFVVLALAQAAWYYREVGVVAHWLEQRGETSRARGPAWTGAPPDYTPPIARSLIQGPSAKAD